jgi:hypothetical protein
MSGMPADALNGVGAISRFTGVLPNSVARKEKWGDGAAPSA